MAVSGTVDASTLGTLRAYLVDGTEVLQRMGLVTIEEPTPEPRLTSLTVGGNTILAPGTATIIDENKQLAANIINGGLLTSGYIVLSATNVSVGGTLNPDAAGNQKFAANSASISGTVNASTPSTLHAYLVDGTTVLQKCGDVQIVAKQARITALTIGSEDALLPSQVVNVSNSQFDIVYSANNIQVLANPRLIISVSLNLEVGALVVPTNSHGVQNGSGNVAEFSDISHGTYQIYLVDSESSLSQQAVVVQALGKIRQQQPNIFDNVTLQGSAWDSEKINVTSPVTSTGTYNGGGSATGVALVRSVNKPTVGSTNSNTIGYAALSGNSFSINNAAVDESSKYWLVACHYNEAMEAYTIDAVYDYALLTPN